ncbi:MAG: VWA domain-containing protein [Euryarchaeota archaeon]|nr:VWA domain-containing protein [Euryarchaeota archaeon]
MTEEIFPVAHPDRPQAACALLLDTSRSMRGEKIRGLEAGVKAYREYVANDPMAKDIVETCIVTFDNEARVVHDFSNVEQIPDLKLEAKGWTAMGAALDKAIEAIEERKRYYKEEGVDYYRPFLVLITDGGPTDMKGKAKFEGYVAKVQEGAKAKKFYPIFFGTKNADLEKLKRLVGESGAVAGIDEARFGDLFQWLSRSVSGLKDSQPGDQIQLVDPTKLTAENPNPFAFEV